ncbi:MAG TPA: hypothetical protein VKA30_00390 [Actinomycetota bacterium]|nr:hypothetical protein [Actinomycetota bacterium]
MRTQLRLTLRIEPSEPISGTIQPEEGVSRPFTGWVGLISLIDGIRGDVRTGAMSCGAGESPQPGDRG